MSRRLGPLGAGLLAVGLLWINWGVGLTMDPRYGAVRGASALTAIPHTSIATWGWVWTVCGLLSCAGAWLPNRLTWIGLVPATVMPIVWALAYCIARLAGEFPQGFNSGFTWLTSPVLLGLLAAATRHMRDERRRRLHLEGEVEQLLTAAGIAKGGA
ncbi:hypothetical protein [Streptomyces sp. NPDC047070]|uniref:hypothetical protein n=1 Tax=Streptomyces sp. NPDC047070 TaxID=3154923 RepID=UPI003453C31D